MSASLLIVSKLCLTAISLKTLNLKTIKTSGGSIQEAEKKAAKKILELINEQ